MMATIDNAGESAGKFAEPVRRQCRFFPVPEIMRLIVHTGKRIDEVPLDWHGASGTVPGHVRFVIRRKSVRQARLVGRQWLSDSSLNVVLDNIPAAPSIPVPTKRSVHSIRESPAGNIPGRSYPNRHDPPDLWTSLLATRLTNDRSPPGSARVINSMLPTLLNVLVRALAVSASGSVTRAAPSMTQDQRIRVRLHHLGLTRRLPTRFGGLGANRLRSCLAVSLQAMVQHLEGN
jgi:hypothetical protein